MDCVGSLRKLVALLMALSCIAGCTSTRSPADNRADAPHWIDWGVFVPDDRERSSDIFTIKQMAGSSPHYVLRFAAIGQHIPIPELTSITNLGAVPILTMEPWQPDGGPIQPDYTLAAIAGGAFDTELDAWARNLAEWNQKLLLRFAHEMNSGLYPWCVGVNGNTAADFVAAWKHVRDRFQRAGASKVSFLWAPNSPYEGATSISEVYPGTDAVDVLGLDGYNWGDGDGHTWKTPEQIFGPGLDELRKLDPLHPIVVTETASVEGPVSGTDKAAWIRNLVDYLSRQDRVTGFVWFQMNKERDWRFNSSQAAQDAFRQTLAARPTP
jgi:Glycosyl hydrolase family 26